VIAIIDEHVITNLGMRYGKLMADGTGCRLCAIVQAIRVNGKPA
jgi:hypothetical protein